MLITLPTSKAQNTDLTINKYRITAYQKGGNQVHSISNEVEIIPAAALYVPSAFTPNGDGLNETFGPKGEGITEFNMQIFDRWGLLIFESNDINMGWDGYLNNEKLPTGIYVYKISAKGQGANENNKKRITKTGTVNIVL